MSIGATLLQPQPLNRFNGIGYRQSLGDEVFDLLQKIALNPEWLDTLSQQVADQLGPFITDFQAHVEARMDHTQAAMATLLQPLTSALNGLVDQDREIETVGDALQLMLDVVDQLAGFVSELSLRQVRAVIDDLLDILFEALGFDQDYLVGLLRHFLEVVIEAVENAPATGSEAFAELRLQLAALARRLQRELLAEVPSLDFNSETIARQLMDKLQQMGLPALQEKAHCLAEKLRAVIDAGTGIYEFVNSASAGGSVGALVRGPLPKIPAIASGSTYCWYASWLYQSRRRNRDWQYLGSYLLPKVPGDEVWISEDGRQLILRHATVAANEGLGGDERDEILYTGSGTGPINWYDAPQFSQTRGQDEHFTFTDALSPQFLEEWTKATSVLVTMSRMVGHIIHATEPGNHVPHSILSVWHACRFFAEPITGVPFTSWIRDRWHLGTAHRSWIDLLFQWMPVVGGSFEGLNTGANQAFNHWITLLGDDANDDFLIYLWPTMVFEGFLSIFTLINQRGDAYTDFDDSDKPKNFEYSYPLTNVYLVLFSFLQSRALGRTNYSHPFEATHMQPFLLHQLLFSWMFGALAGISGEVTGWALSRSVSPRRLLIQLGLGAYKGFGTYIIASYFWNEGDTDGGRYNPNNDFTAGPAFNGYGDANTSPYRLPIPGGRPVFVGQAHQGMFSHFVDGSGATQVYASDFAHDFKEQVSAIRDGVVVDYFDWIPDDINPDGTELNNAISDARISGDLVSNGTNSQAGYTDPAGVNPDGPTRFGGWNFVVVQHSNPNGTESADNLAHDVDQNGDPVTTYAVYGHGANGGVRAAFAARGVAPGDIIGSVINRGEAVMEAGDTGVSFHNHLHLHIRPGPLPGSTGATPEIISQSVASGLAPAPGLGLTGNRTLPIVFGDARHPLKPDGPLQNLTWYRSGNS